jgi:putative chitinase
LSSRTAEGLRALGPNGKRKFIDALAEVADDILDEYQINTPLRVAHFWAQASHECAGFKTMHEYWGPTPAQRRYEGHRDLGNTQEGDGKRYMGRGIFQLTGRANYRTYGGKVGLNLEGEPELAADPVNALRIACLYWKSKGLNRLADENDIKAITRKINGGYNGLADRKANFVIAWRIWGDGERPKPSRKRLLASSTEVRATGAAAGGGAVGIFGAFEAGKEAVEHAEDAKNAAEGAAYLFGLDGGTALLIGGVILLVAGAGYLLWRRWARLDEEEL